MCRHSAHLFALGSCGQNTAVTLTQHADHLSKTFLHLVKLMQAIYDTMNYIKSPVETFCMGQAASMGSFLLAAGAPGKRHVLPNARIMLHQPMGGTKGQVSDIEIAAKELIRMKRQLTEILAKNTGQPVDVITEKCDRDFWMSAEEARDFGIVDHVMMNRTAELV